MVRVGSEVFDNASDKVSAADCAEAIVKVESWKSGHYEIAEKLRLLVYERLFDK